MFLAIPSFHVTILKLYLTVDFFLQFEVYFFEFISSNCDIFHWVLSLRITIPFFFFLLPWNKKKWEKILFFLQFQVYASQFWIYLTKICSIWYKSIISLLMYFLMNGKFLAIFAFENKVVHNIYPLRLFWEYNEHKANSHEMNSTKHFISLLIS